MKNKKELQAIPGVGKSVAKDLYDLGFKKVADLKGEDPEMMYIKLNDLKGTVQDICLLYTFRSAVYYANTFGKQQDPQKLKWWNWMDRKKKTSKVKDAELRKKFSIQK